MRGQVRHMCDRCGFQWIERTSGVMEELIEWIHHASELERDLVLEYERQIRALSRSITLLEHDLTAALNDAAIAKFEAERARRLSAVPF